MSDVEALSVAVMAVAFFGWMSFVCYCDMKTTAAQLAHEEEMARIQCAGNQEDEDEQH